MSNSITSGCRPRAGFPSYTAFAYPFRHSLDNQSILAEGFEKKHNHLYAIVEGALTDTADPSTARLPSRSAVSDPGVLETSGASGQSQRPESVRSFSLRTIIPRHRDRTTSMALTHVSFHQLSLILKILANCSLLYCLGRGRGWEIERLVHAHDSKDAHNPEDNVG